MESAWLPRLVLESTVQPGRSLRWVSEHRAVLDRQHPCGKQNPQRGGPLV